MPDHNAKIGDPNFPIPFPERKHHAEFCDTCKHQLGLHADTFGCIHGWIYDAAGGIQAEGCECPLALAGDYRPPRERDL